MSDELTDLKFPVFEGPSLPSKRMSMDQYARFVQFGWEHAAKRDEQRERRLEWQPTHRFVLR